jgi:hypothetical protein
MQTLDIKPTEVACVTPPCPRCHHRSVVALDRSLYLAWQGGKHIQAVWPDWTAEDRELLISGCHPECWLAIFGSGEE